MCFKGSIGCSIIFNGDCTNGLSFMNEIKRLIESNDRLIWKDCYKITFVSRISWLSASNTIKLDNGRVISPLTVPTPITETPVDILWRSEIHRKYFIKPINKFQTKRVKGFIDDTDEFYPKWSKQSNSFIDLWLQSDNDDEESLLFLWGVHNSFMTTIQNVIAINTQSLEFKDIIDKHNKDYQKYLKQEKNIPITHQIESIIITVKRTPIIESFHSILKDIALTQTAWKKWRLDTIRNAINKSHFAQIVNKDIIGIVLIYTGPEIAFVCLIDECSNEQFINYESFVACKKIDEHTVKRNFALKEYPDINKVIYDYGWCFIDLDEDQSATRGIVCSYHHQSKIKCKGKQCDNGGLTTISDFLICSNCRKIKQYCIKCTNDSPSCKLCEQRICEKCIAYECKSCFRFICMRDECVSKCEICPTTNRVICSICLYFFKCFEKINNNSI